MGCTCARACIRAAEGCTYQALTTHSPCASLTAACLLRPAHCSLPTAVCLLWQMVRVGSALDGGGGLFQSMSERFPGHLRRSVERMCEDLRERDMAGLKRQAAALS